MTIPTSTRSPAAHSLRVAGLKHGLLPVRVPVLVVLRLPGASPDLTSAMERMLDSIRQAARRRQYAIGTEVFGLALAWIGALTGSQRWLFVVGVVFAAAGGLYALNARSHLVRSDAEIGDRFSDYRNRLVDWLSREFSIGAYGDGHGQPTHAIDPGTVKDALDVLCEAGRQGVAQARRRQDALSLLHGLLFVAMIVVAFISARFNLTGPELATVASLVTFAGRANGETIVTAVPDSVVDGPVMDIAQVIDRVDGPDWPTAADLEDLASAWVTIPR